jgi:hypothetical protein
MNRWVLKKFSKDAFNGLADYVKDIQQKLQRMYVCMRSACEKEHNPEG